MYIDSGRFESNRFIVLRTDPCALELQVPLDEPGLFALARRQSHSRVCSAALLTNDVRFMRSGNNVNTLSHSSEWTNGRYPLSVERSAFTRVKHVAFEIPVVILHFPPLARLKIDFATTLSDADSFISRLQLCNRTTSHDI